MLSQQTSLMTDQKARSHRRLNSTTAIEVSALPGTQQQQRNNHPGYQHRRGRSLATTTSAYIPIMPNQDQEQSGTTNTGHLTQHYLQETQLHSQAQPGHIEHAVPKTEHEYAQYRSKQLSKEEFRRLQHQQLDAQLDAMMHEKRFVNQPNQHQAVLSSQVPAGLMVSSVMLEGRPPPDVYFLGEASHGGIKLPNQAWDGHSRRPGTPENQSSAGSLMTPDITPYHTRSQSGVLRKQGNKLNVTDDPNETIKPAKCASTEPSLEHVFNTETLDDQGDPNKTLKVNLMDGRRLSVAEIFEQAHLRADTLPSPPRTAPIPQSETFDAPLITNFSLPSDIAAFTFPSAAMESGHGYLQLAPNETSHAISAPISPTAFDTGRTLDISPMGMPQSMSQMHTPVHSACSSIDMGYYGSPVRLPLSPRSMAIADLGLDATIEDTGISAEEVQAYIAEQDGEQNKWRCLFPGCGKDNFGRKENIRSHVQTHLGDRQYKCLHCDKTFVRQHDLKRHAKIHSGVKPYPCKCGNSFARHDALTRHRQRGICSGGFEGIVKKNTKRGRPRKTRDGDNMTRSERTRQRAVERAYASSVSGTSESSSPQSPISQHEGLDYYSDDQGAMALDHHENFSFPPEVFSQSPPPMSPYSTGNAPSPRKADGEMNAPTPPSLLLEEPHSLMHRQSPVLMRASSAVPSRLSSLPGSPPELSHSSPPSSTQFLDLEFASAFRLDDAGPSSGMVHSPDSFDLFGTPGDMTQDSIHSSWTNSDYFGSSDKEPHDLSMESFTGFNDMVLFDGGHDLY